MYIHDTITKYHYLRRNETIFLNSLSQLNVHSLHFFLSENCLYTRTNYCYCRKIMYVPCFSKNEITKTIYFYKSYSCNFKMFTSVPHRVTTRTYITLRRYIISLIAIRLVDIRCFQTIVLHCSIFNDYTSRVDSYPQITV